MSHGLSERDELHLPEPAPSAAGAVSRNVAKRRGLSQAPLREKCGTNPRGTALTPRQRAALRWLIEGATVSAVADQLGVERRTVGRWKKHPQFVAEAERLCTPADGMGAGAQRVDVNRVTPAVRQRRQTERLRAEMAAGRSKDYIWQGVKYGRFEDYFAAIKEDMGRGVRMKDEG